MKTKKIILFIALQSFVFVVFSQNIKNGFDIKIEENTTWFDDVNVDKYRSAPKNIKGERIGDPSSNFSTLEKFKKIEADIFTAREREDMLVKYSPIILFTVNATNGKILAVTFTFDNLPDASLIDTRKLAEFRERVIAEISYENLLFNGEKAASGYMLAGFMMFKPRK